MKKFKGFLLFAFFLGIFSGSSWAFRLVPFSATLEPSGQGASHGFKVTNDSSEPIAVEVTIKGRQMGFQGEEKLIDEAEDDFVLYPPQFIVPPQGTQTINVQWIGEADLKEEKAFRLIAEQVPVNLQKPDKKEAARVQILLRYVGALYVTPKGAKSKIIVEAVKETKNKKGERQLSVVLHNQGNRHTLLEDITLKLGNLTLKGDQLKGMKGENLLAQTRRQFLIPYPKGLTTLEGAAKVEYNEGD